jgi:hypothetical protein
MDVHRLGAQQPQYGQPEEGHTTSGYVPPAQPAAPAYVGGAIGNMPQGGAAPYAGAAPQAGAPQLTPLSEMAVKESPVPGMPPQPGPAFEPAQDHAIPSRSNPRKKAKESREKGLPKREKKEKVRPKAAQGEGGIQGAEAKDSASPSVKNARPGVVASEKPRGKAGRTAIIVVAILILLLAVLAACGLIAVILMPDSRLAEIIGSAVNNIIGIFNGR